MAERLTIWCNCHVSGASADLLREGTQGHRLIIPQRDRAKAPVRDEAADSPEDAQILFGQPKPAVLLASEQVRWVQLSSAGYTRFDTDDLRGAFAKRGAILTNSSSVFNEPCAQHLAAMMLGLARRLPQSVDNQRGPRVWLQNEARGRRNQLLGGQVVFIYGYGAIARRLVEILAPLRMQIRGVRRVIKGDEGIPMFTEAEADARLGEADHVVNILPDNGTTQKFFGAERLARCKPGARFYNIGRGATVDQRALAEALRSGALDAAYLDVTDPEPLPADHELWDLPNCFITPHVGGAHADEDERLVRHFLRNLAAFTTGEPLLDRVFP